MLKSINELNGYEVLSPDGLVGYAHDFYFDDVTWIIRYLVVDTGKWLPGRKVLVSPIVLGRPDWGSYSLPVNLTKEQIENSPDIDTDKPISRQDETKLLAHYQWPDYWQEVTPVDAGFAGMRPDTYLSAMRAAAESNQKIEEDVVEKTLAGEQTGDPHLRSTNEVLGYHIQASDGEIGHVEDFIYDDDIWTLRYMVIDTRNWLPGKKVLASPQWIEKIIWPNSEVHVNLTREEIKNSPEYDPSTPINRAYETRLYDYYGRPTYWP